MLLAEELALVAIKPDTGRHAVGMREVVNACLAGLLVAELLLDGLVVQGDRDDAILVAPGGFTPASPTLAAASEVVTEKGPKLKAVLSHMSRGLQQRLGMGTWDTVTAGLAEAGVVGPATGGRPSRHPIVDGGARDAVVDRLRSAAGDGPLDLPTALVLSMTGPAHLLEVVAPDRSDRKHARSRIDHALDGTGLEAVGKVVHRLVQEATAVSSGYVAG